MDNIRVRRASDDPEIQGIVEPDSKRWQLVIDAEGYPHLYIQVKVIDDEGQAVDGMFCLDYMLEAPIKELMDGGFFDEPVSPEEAREYMKAWNVDPNRPPCPR